MLERIKNTVESMQRHPSTNTSFFKKILPWIIGVFGLGSFSGPIMETIETISTVSDTVTVSTSDSLFVPDSTAGVVTGPSVRIEFSDPTDHSWNRKVSRVNDVMGLLARCITVLVIPVYWILRKTPKVNGGTPEPTK